MAAFNKYEQFAGDLDRKIHDFRAAGDTLKVALTNTAPNAATHAVLADITEIAAGNGYTAGGDDVQNDESETGGVSTVTGIDVVFTASGGAIAQFRYIVLYNDTPASPLNPLIGWWDHGSAVDLLDTQLFTVDFGASLFTVT